MTPQPPGVPQHIQIELARRELKSLREQQTVADYGIQLLTGMADKLNGVRYNDTDAATTAILAALVALSSLRLTELQNSHKQLEPRILELEGALRIADSGIVRPVRN